MAAGLVCSIVDIVRDVASMTGDVHLESLVIRPVDI